MNIKSTIIVFVLAVFSAAAAIYTHNSDQKDDKKNQGPVPLLIPEQFPRDAINKITLASNNS